MSSLLDLYDKKVKNKAGVKTQKANSKYRGFSSRTSKQVVDTIYRYEEDIINLYLNKGSKSTSIAKLLNELERNNFSEEEIRGVRGVVTVTKPSFNNGQINTFLKIKGIINIEKTKTTRTTKTPEEKKRILSLLIDRQVEILRLRMQGESVGAIGKFLKIEQGDYWVGRLIDDPEKIKFELSILEDK